MLSNAFALAILTTGGAYLVYKKLPKRVREFLEKHALLSDFLAFIAVYWMLGGTLTALVAAGICGVMVSGMLHIAQHPEDFLYLYDAQMWLKEHMGNLRTVLNDYGKIYRQRKQVAISS